MVSNVNNSSSGLATDQLNELLGGASVKRQVLLISQTISTISFGGIALSFCKTKVVQVLAYLCKQGTVSVIMPLVLVLILLLPSFIQAANLEPGNTLKM